jgi:uncharacterized protein (TIGR00369 family)
MVGYGDMMAASLFNNFNALSGLEYVQGMIEGKIKINFHDYFGIIFTRAAEGETEAIFALSPDNHNNGDDIVHGGVSAAIADAGAYTYRTVLPAGKKCVSMGMTTENIKPIKAEEGFLRAKSTVVKPAGGYKTNPRDKGDVVVKIYQGDILKTQATIKMMVLDNPLP